MTQMSNKAEWNSLGWTTKDDSVKGFSITRDSDMICNRCGQAGPWMLRALSGGELAHRDYAVCRCGELVHVSAVWPGAQRP